MTPEERRGCWSVVLIIGGMCFIAGLWVWMLVWWMEQPQ